MTKTIRILLILLLARCVSTFVFQTDTRSNAQAGAAAGKLPIALCDAQLAYRTWTVSIGSKCFRWHLHSPTRQTGNYKKFKIRFSNCPQNDGSGDGLMFGCSTRWLITSLKMFCHFHWKGLIRGSFQCYQPNRFNLCILLK